MKWEAAKREIERRALAIHRRNAGTPLWIAVRNALEGSPTLWQAYREAMANWEEQEFVSRRPHHARRDSRLEYMARKRIARSLVPLTLRDAMLQAFDAEVRMERRAERERDRRLAKKRSRSRSKRA